MGMITQYRPVTEQQSQFANVEELLSIPFVANFQHAIDGFYRYSIWTESGCARLMAEYDDGRKWFVVGSIDGDVPALPTWQPVRSTPPHRLIDWQQRVVQERDELASRLIALTGFISRGEADASAGVVDLLREQRDIMQQYVAILDRRIAAFG